MLRALETPRSLHPGRSPMNSWTSSFGGSRAANRPIRCEARPPVELRSSAGLSGGNRGDQILGQPALNAIDIRVFVIEVVQLVDEALDDAACGLFFIVGKEPGKDSDPRGRLGDLAVPPMLFQVRIEDVPKGPIVVGLPVDLEHGAFVDRHGRDCARASPGSASVAMSRCAWPRHGSFFMLAAPMARWKNLLERAKKLANDHLPPDVVDAGRRLLDEVVDPAPATSSSETDYAARRAQEALERLRSKAEHGLKPEDRLVVIYATEDEAEAVGQIREALAGIEGIVREMDLRKEPPQTARQLAKLTGVMVPPYVYINGRYWGAQYEMISLRESGDLEHVVANRIDMISDGARRIGGIHEAFSDAMTPGNILDRWKLGHILCVDDLDSWYEVERNGSEHFYYQGGPRDATHMQAVAEEIAAGVESGEIEAHWLLEPSVHLTE